ncbi:MAG: hypothetical protein Q9191_004436 [Dirinaria sp. TL-2023a]
MAAASPIILTSSSPVPQVCDRTPLAKSYNMSSSPGLPSVSKFFVEISKRAQISSKGSPCPGKPAIGLARASSQSRQPSAVILSDDATPLDKADSPTDGKTDGGQGLSKSNKQTRKAVTGGDTTTTRSEALKAGNVLHPKPQEAPAEDFRSARKSIANNLSGTASEAVEARAAQKTCSKTVKSSVQSTIKKGKVTKAAGSRPSKNESKGPKSAQTLEEPLEQEVSEASVTQDGDITLGLEGAVRRRRNWTPIKDTDDDSLTPDSVDETLEGQSKLQDPTAGEPRCEHLKSLLGDYEYAHKTSAVTTKPEIARRSSGEALTKRRKVEVGSHDPGNRLQLIENQLVPVSLGPSSDVVRFKSKSPKKKPQTVTGKATAPFISIGEPQPNGIRQYLALDSNPEITNEVDSVETGQLSKGKARKKRTGEGKATGKKRSKEVSVLLPPEAALKSTDQQDLLFGTSSQLARDECPAYLREMQQAIAESETFNSTTLPAHDGAIPSSTASGSTAGSNTFLYTASRNLWSAAARNQNGALQDAEFVDLSITPNPRVSRDGDVSEAQPAKADNSGWTIIDDTPKGPDAVDSNSTSTSSRANQDIQVPIPRSLAEASLRNRPRSRSPIKKSGEHILKGQSVEEKPQGMPNYRGFTTAELTKGIAAYGFKPIKRRDQQIALLEKCWKSKNSAALQSFSTNVYPSEVPVAVEVDSELPKQKSPPREANPAKKRGRPPKAKAPAQPNENEERGGKDRPLTRTKGRPKKAVAAASSPKQAAKKTSPAKSKPTPTTEDIVDLDATPKPLITDGLPPSPLAVAQPDPTSSADTTLTPLDRTALLDKITEAVTTYPPTHDMNNLTWYEKMLMYDPIVLEDLALWLNTEGLGKVGVDEEVSSGMVKEWCEARSVCCLWRENLRGGVRARY